MFISINNRQLIVLISLVSIVVFAGSGFAASIDAPRIIPNGKVFIYNDNQKIAALTEESPLPDGKLLKVKGTCGIKLNSLYLVATDKSVLTVRMKQHGQEIFVKDGKVFFGISAMPEMISFFTPNGGILAQQVILKTSSQSSMLEGYINVLGEKAEIGVIRGGTMVISTGDGEKTISTGERFLLAQAKIPVEGENGAATMATGSGLSGGYIAVIGGSILAPLLGGVNALNNNRNTNGNASSKQ